MKYCINGFLIVEGNNDKSYLSSFLDCEIVVTNGFDINNTDLNYIKVLSKTLTPIILVDSDESGFVIRKKLNEIIPNAQNVIVDINKCDKNGKHGIAECDKNEILNKLEIYSSNNKPKKDLYSLNDIISLGVDCEDKRNFLSQELNLGKCNAKTFVHRLNVLNIDKNELKKILEDKYGNQ